MPADLVQAGAKRLSQRLLALSEVAKTGSETPDRVLFSGLSRLLEELAREARELADAAGSSSRANG